MRELLNVFSKGTEGIPINSDPLRSSINVPSNEDWTGVCKIISWSEGIAQAKKIWDTSSSPRIFYAQCPLPLSGYVTLHRINNNWYTFPEVPLVFVRDLGEINGERHGREIRFLSDKSIVYSNSISKKIKACDLSSHYHDQRPPYSLSRIYLAVDAGEFYIAILSGFGDETVEQFSNLFTFSVAGTKIFQFNLGKDTQGNLISLNVDGTSHPFDTTFQCRGKIGGIKIGSAGIGNFYCLYEHQAKHVRNTGEYSMMFYDVWTGSEFTGFRYSIPKTRCEFSYRSSLENNRIGFKIPGTGIENKMTLMPPNTHPYDVPPNLVGQVVEIGCTVTGTATSGSATQLTDNTEHFGYAHIQIGDTISTLNPTRTETITSVSGSTVFFSSGSAIVGGTTTYAITPANPNRSSTGNDSFISYPWYYWSLEGLTVYNAYNPATDTTGAGDYACMDGIEPFNGFNDESEKYVLAISGTPNLQIPGWNSYANKYISPIHYVTGHEFTGGRIYWSREANKHWFVNSVVPGVYFWDNFSAGTYLNFDMAQRDQWNGRIRTGESKRLQYFLI